MNIYTSYFANVKNIDKDIVPISIARSRPRFSNSILPYLTLAPAISLLYKYKEHIITEIEYTQIYNEKLSKISVDVVLKDLERIGGGKDVVLLCWEGKGKFCHRNLVARWLRENGIDCKEYVNEVNII